MRPSNRLLGSSRVAKPSPVVAGRRRIPRFAPRPRLRRGAFVGVDIGTTAVKLVELSPSRQLAPNAGHRGAAYRVLACGLEPLPPGAVSGAQANISDPGAVGEAIRRLRRRTRAKARNAALAIPHAAAVVKTLRLDATLTDDEMEMEVALEAEHLFPFPPGETALDFEPAQLCLDDPALVEVIVVGCRSEHARARQAAAAAGGLKATVLEVETTALARAAALAPPALLAIVDLGDTKATLLAIEGGALLFARQEPFDTQQTANGTAPEVEELVRQISRLLRLFFAAQGDEQYALDQLLVSGGRAGTPGLAETATEKLGLPVALADPFDQMAFRIARPSKDRAGNTPTALRHPAATGNAPVSRQTPRAEDGAPPPGQDPPPIPHGAGAHVDAAKSPVLATACGLALRGVAAEPGECPAAVAETPPPTVGNQP